MISVTALLELFTLSVCFCEDGVRKSKSCLGKNHKKIIITGLIILPLAKIGQEGHLAAMAPVRWEQKESKNSVYLFIVVQNILVYTNPLQQVGK